MYVWPRSRVAFFARVEFSQAFRQIEAPSEARRGQATATEDPSLVYLSRFIPRVLGGTGELQVQRHRRHAEGGGGGRYALLSDRNRVLEVTVVGSVDFFWLRR